MASDDDKLQLDLTESITEVPQASSITLFVSLMEALRGEERTFVTLASLLDVDERTARYYADFGRWLQWIQPAGDGKIRLTSRGRAFVDSSPARGRLFATAIFERPLVQTIQRLKREQFSDHCDPEATRRACRRAVEGMTTLSENTATRRASSLASMLRWAYKPGQIDWATGRTIDVPTAPFDFRGQSFLSAYAARQFGGSKSIQIGFPRQVVTFATGAGETLRAEDWDRASYETENHRHRWFGSIPINDSTLSVARRGGPDLRRLLVNCNPYLAILVTLFAPPSTSAPSPVRLTADMYGLRLWYRDRELGTPLEAIAELAAQIDLTPVDIVPHLTIHKNSDNLQPASDEDLATVLKQTGIVRRVETTLALAPGVGSELRLPVGDGPTLWERTEPLRAELLDALRHVATS